MNDTNEDKFLFKINKTPKTHTSKIIK